MQNEFRFINEEDASKISSLVGAIVEPRRHIGTEGSYTLWHVSFPESLAVKVGSERGSFSDGWSESEWKVGTYLVHYRWELSFNREFAWL